MIIVRAPLRISLGGGGTDLPGYFKKNGGFVEINNPKDDDFNFQDIIEILDSKNIKNYRFSYSSPWGLEVNIGIHNS